MNRLFQKYLYGLICTILLFSVLVITFRMTEKETVTFSVDTNTASYNISIFDAGNGKQYVFLPSCTQMQNLKVHLSFGARATLNGISLENGMFCDKFELNKPYIFENGTDPFQTITFLRSSNIASMHINTDSGDMEHIHLSKENSEYAGITVLTETGIENYRSDGCVIKGRGNATWAYDKKSYLITLPKEEDLLGMGSSTKWVLLANAADESNLHNKIVMDYARKTGSSWIPRCTYVDLYLNGVYSGLYLLCEKIEVAEHRLELDTDAGDFLCRVEMNNRWNILKNPFISMMDRAIEITEPDIYTEEEKQIIKNQIDTMEMLIQSGSDLEMNPLFDVNSWIDKYLIDEIFANIDSDLCSSYFYRKNGILYAGPIWDYDMVLGNNVRNMNADSFVAKNLYKTVSGVSVYYDALYQNEYFYTQMTKAYQLKYLPALHDLVNSRIEQMNQEISDASMMNSIRWKDMYQYIFENEPIYKTDAETISKYLQERIHFLNRAWIDGEPFCTVQFLLDDVEYTSVSVTPGTVLSSEILGITEAQWNDLRNRTQVDLSMPITKDTLLDRYDGHQVSQTPDMDENVTNEISSTQDYITLASIAVLLLFFILLSLVSIRNNYIERRRLNYRTGTKVSL